MCCNPHALAPLDHEGQACAWAGILRRSSPSPSPPVLGCETLGAGSIPKVGVQLRGGAARGGALGGASGSSSSSSAGPTSSSSGDAGAAAGANVRCREGGARDLRRCTGCPETLVAGAMSIWGQELDEQRVRSMGAGSGPRDGPKETGKRDSRDSRMQRGKKPLGHPPTPLSSIAAPASSSPLTAHDLLSTPSACRLASGTPEPTPPGASCGPCASPTSARPLPSVLMLATLYN